MAPPETTHDFTFGCASCDEQIVIESAPSREVAMLIAINTGGWFRATETELECPACGKSRVDRRLKGDEE